MRIYVQPLHWQIVTIISMFYAISELLLNMLMMAGDQAISGFQSNKRNFVTVTIKSVFH